MVLPFPCSCIAAKFSFKVRDIDSLGPYTCEPAIFPVKNYTVSSRCTLRCYNMQGPVPFIPPVIKQLYRQNK